MRIDVCPRPLLSALALAAALCVTPALATTKAPQPLGTSLSGAAGGGPLPASATLYTFDVSGIYSYELEGSPLNEVRQLTLFPNAQIVGIGWNVTLFADPPSWLSEMTVSFGSTTVVSVYLTPGINDSFSGTRSYSSGGVVDLIGLGLDFTIGADGKLRMEFHETYNDYLADWDGLWQSGTLTIAAVPEPSTYGLMALGLLGLGAWARRRRA